MRLKNIWKSEKGASIIETLVALGFIGVVSTSFLSLAITARKLSFQHRVQNELGQYAGMVTEEMLKDYTVTGVVRNSSYYCSSSSVSGALVNAFLIKNQPSSCEVLGDVNSGYTITLKGTAFGKEISSIRTLKLQ